MAGWNSSRHHWRTITPSLRPPPSSATCFHSPDFYTVLQALVQQRGPGDRGPSYGYRQEYACSGVSTTSDESRVSHSLASQRESYLRHRIPPSPSPSSALTVRPSQQLPLSRSCPPLPVLPEQQYRSNDRTSRAPPNENHCSEIEALCERDRCSSVDVQRLSHSTHLDQVSNKDQGMQVVESASVSRRQLQMPSEYHHQKIGINSESGTCESRKPQTARKTSAPDSRCRNPELKQSKLMTTPEGSIQIASCRAETGMRNGKNAGNAPPPSRPGSEQRQSEQAQNWRDVRKMTQGQLDTAETLLFSVDECAMSLVFSNQSTQLRDGKAKSTKVSLEIEGICVAIPMPGSGAVESSRLQFFFFALDPQNSSLDNWCKNQLIRIMQRARVICYDGQEIVTTLINHFRLHLQPGVWLGWHPLDVRVGAWLLDPDNVPNNFHQTLSRFNVQLPSDPPNQVPFEDIACQDISLMGPLMVKVYQSLQACALWSLFTEVETKLIPILGSMEANGIQVNTGKLLHYAELLKIKIAKVETSAHKAAKHTFSINSTLQLRQVLFDELQLDKQCSKKLSKTHVQKHKSTSEAVLTQLQDLHPLPGLVLEYRQLCKMNATYISGILPYISEGILHPCWQQTGAATGRLVSCNPNIQAFPKQAIDLGAVKEQYIVGKESEKCSIDVREAVESREDHSFIATDFRSIELRLLAHLSGDPALISILTTSSQSTSSDVFVHLAAQWFNISVDRVTPGDREKAKRVVYAIVYGVGKEKLADILSVNSNTAKELITSFLNTFSGVKTFMQKTVAETKNKGYAKTICHRKRWFPHINSGNPHLRSYSERQAINFPIQGSAADICKCAMVQVMQMLARESTQTKLLLQIHDELLFEVPDADIQLVSDKVKAVLESSDLIPSCSLKVPLEVRVTVGKSWASLTAQ